MKKDTLIEIILGTVGGLIFAIGMCMCLLPELNLLVAGVVTAIIGFVVLLAIIPVYRKTHPKKQRGPVNVGLIMTWLIGIAGALVMGFGMSRVMVDEASQSDILVGIIVGIVGLLICALNYPVYAYLRGKKED